MLVQSACTDTGVVVIFFLSSHKKEDMIEQHPNADAFEKL